MNSLFPFAAVLLVPFAFVLGCCCLTLLTEDSRRTSQWITCRRWIHVIQYCTVAAWWALWDAQERSGSVSSLAYSTGIDPSFVRPVYFFGPIIVTTTLLYLICYSVGARFLSLRWTAFDLLRLSFVRTTSPTVALLSAAAGFDAAYNQRLTAIVWLVGAGALAIFGAIGLRLAEGLKFRKVKSGELYKRAFTLAREMKVPLKEVYVVPAGRGHLTNAYGLSQSIAVTDNYGKFLKRTELDFVIGHELGHVQERHGRKKQAVMLAIYSGATLLCTSLSSAPARFRPVLDVVLVFVPILTFYFLSRRFEYEADQTAVELTRAPETGIQALASTYLATQAPLQCDRFTELFMTHPSFTRRAWAIGRVGQVPTGQLSDLIREVRREGATEN